jgi:hypothetical protein
MPLLARWVSLAQPQHVPAPVREEIKRSAQTQAMQTLMLAGETVSLSRRLERAGIPVIVLKGAALAMRAYGELALRPQNDVDLLVHARDVDRAMTELAAAGYSRVYDLAPGQDAAFREIEYHYSMVNAAGTSVELHWGIIKRQFGLSVREELWWSGTQRVAVGGAEVMTLSNELTLIYLAIHGGKHEWPQLRWIGDIAAVERLRPMDWEFVRRTSASLGTLRMTALALALANAIAGAPLPEPAKALAGEHSRDALEAEIVRRLGARADAPGFVASTKFQLALRERARDRLAFAMRHAVTPNIDDLETAELSAGWRGLYVLMRPLRLMRKWLIDGAPPAR